MGTGTSKTYEVGKIYLKINDTVYTIYLYEICTGKTNIFKSPSKFITPVSRNLYKSIYDNVNSIATVKPEEKKEKNNEYTNAVDLPTDSTAQYTKDIPPAEIHLILDGDVLELRSQHVSYLFTIYEDHEDNIVSSTHILYDAFMDIPHKRSTYLLAPSNRQVNSQGHTIVAIENKHNVSGDSAEDIKNIAAHVYGRIYTYIENNHKKYNNYADHKLTHYVILAILVIILGGVALLCLRKSK